MIKVQRWTYEARGRRPAFCQSQASSSVRGRRARSMKANAVLCTALLTSLSLLGASLRSVQAKEPAHAEPGPKDKKPPSEVNFAAEVSVLHATNSKKGIDGRIGQMPELKKPPFSSYDSYELLDRVKLPLEHLSPKTLKLPNGRVLETRLLEVLTRESVRLSASINQPGGKEFLPLLEVKAKVGQPFIVAGQRYKQGILVLVIRVTK